MNSRVSRMLFIGLSTVLLLTAGPGPLPAGLAQGERIQPEDVVYLGAFRLPRDIAEEVGWAYAGQALAYYPDGDPDGPDDGFPGSLFGTGHNWYQYVTELSIPAPVIADSVEALPEAVTLQAPADIRGGLFADEEMEIPQVGLAYLPAQGDQTAGHLYFSWSPWLPESDYRPSFGWASLDLSDPQPAGPWSMAGYTRYHTANYMFPLDAAWAAAHTGGRTLATGRFREGGQEGAGPALFAIAPWMQGNPPAPGTALEAVRLLQYQPYDAPAEQRLAGYADSDQWTGAAWLTAGDAAAFVVIGSKGLGETWYGFANGLVWEEPYPAVPDWPYDQRGFWSDDFEAQILFYDPADLAAVIDGTLEAWEPQPYGVLSIDQYLFDTDDEPVVKLERVGAAAADLAHGLLYIIEPSAYEDAYAVMHVFGVGG